MLQPIKLHYPKGDFTGEDLFVGIDVHKRQWSVSVRARSIALASFVHPPNAEQLASYLRRHYPGAHYHCVYEAGFTGFSIQRQLASLGIDCMVVHPPDIPTTDKERQTKTDRVDSRKLGARLSQGELQGIYVPSASAEEDRALVRHREQLVTDQTRCKNRIKSALYFHGIAIPHRTGDSDEEMVTRHWSRRFIAWLQSITLTQETGTATLQYLLKELLFIRSEILDVTRSIRLLSRTARYAADVQLLTGLPGISMLSAMTLLVELVDIQRFGTRDKFASYFGMVPRVHSSGDSEQSSQMTKRRNSSLRRMLIECAWVAVRHDAVFSADFIRRAQRMPRSRAIVGSAHMLLRQIWRVLKTRTPYQPIVDDRSSTVDDRSSTVDDRSSTVDDRSSTVDDRSSTVDDRSSTVAKPAIVRRSARIKLQRQASAGSEA